MEGIRILEVAEHTFVPAASAILADWGAEVIKVEHVERGDAMRGLGSTGVMNLGGGVHVLLEHSNRGKRSIGLDLSKPEGLDILYQLAAQCDVFLTNKMPGVRERLHIDVDDIRAHNPSIVYVRGSGYGARGPEADRGGYDQISLLVPRRQRDGRRSPRSGTTSRSSPRPAYGDSLGAMTIAGGIAAALFHRERTGEATVVDVSLLGVGHVGDGRGRSRCRSSSVPRGCRRRPTARRSGTRSSARTARPTTAGSSLSMLQGFHYWPEMCAVLGRRGAARRTRASTPTRRCSRTRPRRAGSSPRCSRRPRSTSGSSGSRTSRASGRQCRTRSRSSTTRRCRRTATCSRPHTKDGVPFKLVTTPVQFDEEPVAAAARTGVQRARRRDPHRGPRHRLGHRHRPEGQRRRRLSPRTAPVMGPSKRQRRAATSKPARLGHPGSSSPTHGCRTGAARRRSVLANLLAG